MCLSDPASLAHSVDQDQIAPLGGIWSGAKQLAQACLFKYLG